MFAVEKWRAVGLAATGVLATAFFSTTARADDSDPFWGPDKALHFAVAGMIAGVSYGATTAVTDDRWKAFAIGGTAAVGAGALKEGFDAAGFGDPSWKDFAWDVIGGACGLGVAWVIDVAVQGGRVPPWSASSVAAAATPTGARLVVRF
jgi:putative lipoprotein